MAYKQSVYIKAKSVLDSRKAKAENEMQIRRATAIAKCPEILKIEQKMAGCGAEAIRLIGHGKDTEAEIAKISLKSRESQQARKQALIGAGFPEDYLQTKYFCPICSDTGYHDGYRCKCYNDLILQCARAEVCSVELLDACSFAKFSLDYYSDEKDAATNVSPRAHMTNVLQICKDFCSDFKSADKGLFFFGKTGLGKTHLSIAIADEVTKKGYNVLYTSVQNAMNKVEKEHFGKSNSDESYIDELCDADLLILDDLGAEFITSFTVPQLYNILNNRIITMKPTIISTNLNFDEVESKYGQRIMSRIIGSFNPIMFFGKDIRQIKANL